MRIKNRKRLLVTMIALSLSAGMIGLGIVLRSPSDTSKIPSDAELISTRETYEEKDDLRITYPGYAGGSAHVTFDHPTSNTSFLGDILSGERRTKPTEMDIEFGWGGKRSTYNDQPGSPSMNENLAGWVMTPKVQFLHRKSTYRTRDQNGRIRVFTVDKVIPTSVRISRVFTDWKYRAAMSQPETVTAR